MYRSVVSFIKKYRTNSSVTRCNIDGFDNVGRSGREIRKGVLWPTYVHLLTGFWLRNELVKSVSTFQKKVRLKLGHRQ